MDYNEILIRGNKRQAIEDLQLMEKIIRKKLLARSIVEIGSMDGTSSILLGSLAKEFGGHLYAIEPIPKARWFANMEMFGLTESVTHIKAYSPWLDISQIALPIDFLLIDGDHRTRWALVDYHFWFPYVRIGGAIAFHDYNGRKGVAEWVRQAINIILEDDKDKLKEFGRNKTPDRGLIIFEKVAQ